MCNMWCCDVVKNGAWCGMLCNDQHMWCGVMCHIFRMWNCAWCGMWCDARCGVQWNVQCGMWCNVTLELCAAVKWCMMWNVMWWATCKVPWCVFVNGMVHVVECGMRCGMRYSVTAPCFATSHHHMVVIWNGAWCGVVRCGMIWDVLQCYHSSIIPHLTAPHSTTSLLVTCNTMLCRIILPHGVRWGVLCHVFCDMEWACGMWCGVMWNVLQCYHTMLWHSTPAHITQHSHSFPHCTTPQQHNSTSHCTTFHISACYTVQTMLCPITPPPIAHYEMWCDVSCDRERCMKWSVVWCGMRCYTLHNMLCHITPPHIAHHSCTFLWHSHITCRIMCNMWWCDVARWCTMQNVM